MMDDPTRSPESVEWPNKEEVVGGVDEVPQDADLPGLDDDLDREMEN